MHTAITLQLSDLLPTDLLANCVHPHHQIQIPSWAFRPDEWSWAFLRGLHQLDLDGLHLWEVGVGTGLNQVLLRQWFPEARLRFSDYNPLCTRLACANLEACQPHGLEPLHGKWDLVTDTEASCTEVGPVDVIVACIPQVPANGFDLGEGDNLAHYYDTSRYTEAARNVHGLGLNEALLNRAHHVLRPGGRVVLNLGGRPGLQLLLDMFQEYGYAPRVVHQEVIPQHSETSLASLGRLENEGHPPFEFFMDTTAQQPISAAQAETRRVEGQPVFHKIYVIEGTLLR